MKFFLLASVFFTSVTAFAQSTLLQNKKDSIIGTWIIDLRPTPGSEPYLKEFKFTKIEGKNLMESFMVTRSRMDF